VVTPTVQQPELPALEPLPGLARGRMALARPLKLEQALGTERQVSGLQPVPSSRELGPVLAGPVEVAPQRVLPALAQLPRVLALKARLGPGLASTLRLLPPPRALPCRI
jgi:hypothetical protein